MCAEGGDYTYDQCGNQTGYVETGGPDRHFMNLNDGRRVQIDGRPIAGSTPYRIIDNPAALDHVARQTSRAEDDNYTAFGAYLQSRRNGGDLDFKPDINARFGVRTLWNAGSVGGQRMYVHNDKVANAAWGHYMNNNTIVSLQQALDAAAGQASAVGAVGENLDQIFIRRGWGIPR